MKDNNVIQTKSINTSLTTSKKGFKTPDIHK